MRTPGTLGGRPRIADHRIGVDTTAIKLVYHGVSPEQLVSEDYWPYLTLAQVHAALAYYYANREEVDNDIREDADAYEAAALEARRNGQGTRPGR